MNNSIDYKKLGDRIKEKRVSKNLSQMDLAERCKLSSQHISNVENARTKIGLDKLVTIAVVLECSIDELLMDSFNYKQNTFVYDNKMFELLKDMSDTERKMLPVVICNFKETYSFLKKEIEKSFDD